MIQFILNEKPVATSLSPGMVLLDFIRYHQHLTGTKIGCREGDCGACTVLVGELHENKLHYTSATSCLMPLGNAHRKHIVTIEGINAKREEPFSTEKLTPVQDAMALEGASQCGFCTPGFAVSLTGYCLTGRDPDKIETSIDGNICRCTGYKSIQRAAERITSLLKQNKDHEPIGFAVKQGIIPSYFNRINEELGALHSKTNGISSLKESRYFTGGGTDLYVQKPEELSEAPIHFLYDQPELKGIYRENDRCVIGPSATVTDLLESELMRSYFPNLDHFISLVSSTPIRNMATIAGNFVNASPIGDLTIFFLALDARLELHNGTNKREVPLRGFYKSYKTLDKKEDEFIRRIWFDLPDPNSFFHFEKVSKRTNLDIASVNSALMLKMDGPLIKEGVLSAGGVAPVPLFLKKASAFLENKIINPTLINELVEQIQMEVSPISDARGSEAYKRLLLTQLIKAHFMQFFPSLFPKEAN